MRCATGVASPRGATRRPKCRQIARYRGLTAATAAAPELLALSPGPRHLVGPILPLAIIVHDLVLDSVALPQAVAVGQDAHVAEHVVATAFERLDEAEATRIPLACFALETAAAAAAAAAAAPTARARARARAGGGGAPGCARAEPNQAGGKDRMQAALRAGSHATAVSPGWQITFGKLCHQPLWHFTSSIQHIIRISCLSRLQRRRAGAAQKDLSPRLSHQSGNVKAEDTINDLDPSRAPGLLRFGDCDRDSGMLWRGFPASSVVLLKGHGLYGLATLI